MLVNNLHQVIVLEKALQLDNVIYVDMRSPFEFQEGHIPGAVNIPLFTDEERTLIGLTYKQIGAEEAKQQGLLVVSTKLPDLVSQIRSLCKSGKTVVIYCWRGGMRSKSMVTVLELMGIRVYQLLGGYKSYRRYVLDSLASFYLEPAVVVLCGSTGVGKTSILSKLSQRGIAALDLERLANHRGSAFGHVGLGRPATAQNFDATILGQLQELNNEPCLAVECESKRIGNVYVPEVLYRAMQQGPRILLQADIEIRITRLIEEYTGIYQNNKEAIGNSIEALRKRLGQRKTNQLLADLKADETRQVVRVLLTDYYDPLYGYEAINETSYATVINANDLDKATSEVIEFLQQWRR